MDKVSFVNKISTLMKATSDDAYPIPGYLYQEVNKITFESDGYLESTLEFLVDRLNKPSCHVKYKVLKLLKYIVENGPVRFKHGLIKCSHGVREATQFSGPEDPLHGNIPNKAVRKLAKELTELLFDTEEKQNLEHRNKREEPDRSRMTGYGNTNVSPKGGLQGFGNSPNKTKGSFMDKLSRFAGSFQDKTKEQQAAILSSIESHGDYRPPPCPVFYTEKESPPSKTEVTTPKEEPVQHVPGKIGGGWEDDSEIDFITNSVSSQDGDRVDFITNSDGIENTEESSEERSLVVTTINCDEELLPLSEIKEFISSCQNLNCERVVDILNEHLKSSCQSTVMKSLLLVEYLMNSGLVNCDYIFKTCQHHLSQLSEGESSISSSKAKKMALTLEKLLGLKILTNNKIDGNQQVLLMED